MFCNILAFIQVIVYIISKSLLPPLKVIACMFKRKTAVLNFTKRYWYSLLVSKITVIYVGLAVFIPALSHCPPGRERKRALHNPTLSPVIQKYSVCFGWFMPIPKRHQSCFELHVYSEQSKRRKKMKESIAWNFIGK